MFGKKWAWVFCMARTSWHVETGTAVVGWYRRSAPACGVEHSCNTLLLTPSCATTPAIPSFWPPLYYNSCTAGCAPMTPLPGITPAGVHRDPLSTAANPAVDVGPNVSRPLVAFLWLFALVMVICAGVIWLFPFSPAKVLSPSADEELTRLAACSSDCWTGRS